MPTNINSWTNQESSTLLQILEQQDPSIYRSSKRNSNPSSSQLRWSYIAQLINKCHGGNKTGAMTSQHYRRVAKADIQRGRWSAEEELRLIEAVLRHGLDSWVAISACVRTRTDTGCSYMYEKFLEDVRACWTKEELASLTKVVLESKTSGPTENGCSVDWEEVAHWMRRIKQVIPIKRRHSRKVKLVASGKCKFPFRTVLAYACKWRELEPEPINEIQEVEA